MCKLTTKGQTDLEPLRVAVEHLAQVELLHLLLESRRQAGVHARSTRENDVLVEVGPDIDRGGLDRVEEHLGHARLLDVDQVRLEHAFRRLEPLRANLDDAAVREREVFDEDGRILRKPLVLLEVVPVRRWGGPSQALAG